MSPARFSIATVNQKNQRAKSFSYIHYNFSDLQFVWLAVYLHLSVARTGHCRKENTQTSTERNNANPSPALNGKQTVNYLQEYQTKIPDLTCLLQDASPPSRCASWRQMGSLSAGGGLEQLIQCISRNRQLLRETETPRNFLCVRPNTAQFLLHRMNTTRFLKMKYLLL